MSFTNMCVMHLITVFDDSNTFSDYYQSWQRRVSYTYILNVRFFSLVELRCTAVSHVQRRFETVEASVSSKQFLNVYDRSNQVQMITQSVKISRIAQETNSEALSVNKIFAKYQTGRPNKRCVFSSNRFSPSVTLQ